MSFLITTLPGACVHLHILLDKLAFSHILVDMIALMRVPVYG